MEKEEGTPQAPKAKDEVWECSSCGAEVTDKDEFCPQCGESLEEEGGGEGATKSSSEPSKPTPRWVVIAVGLALVALIAVAFWKPKTEDKAAEGGSGGSSDTASASNPENENHDIKVDGDVVWVGSSGGVIKYDRKDLKFLGKFTTSDGLSHDFVESVFHGPNGEKWFGTYAGPVSVYEGNGWRQTILMTDAGPVTDKGNHVVTADRAGAIWVGSMGAGLFKIEGEKLTHYSTKDGLPSGDVRCLIQDKDGSYWACTAGGPAHFENGKWVGYTGQDGKGLAGDVWTGIIDKDGNKWFGFWEKGIIRFDGKTWTRFLEGPQGPISNWVYRSAMDAKGHLWFAGAGGVSVWEGGSWRRYAAADGLLGQDVYALDIDKEGYKWFGTFQGLSRLDPENKEWVTARR